MSAPSINTSRTHIISLYREILKAANKLPKDFQRNFVVEKARFMFRQPKQENEIVDSIRLAMTHLDDIQAQVHALSVMRYTDDRKTDQQLAEEGLQQQRLVFEQENQPDWAQDEEQEQYYHK